MYNFCFGGVHMSDINYKLFSDSTCDLSKEILDTMDVFLFDLAFEVDGKSYIGGQMTLPAFYDAMRRGAMTKTSQVSPQTYEEEFEKCIKEGYNILHLGFSSGLSGSFQAAGYWGQGVESLAAGQTSYFRSGMAPG